VTANKAPTLQRLEASKERTLKNPETEEEVFCIICLAVHKRTVPNLGRGYAENAKSFTEGNNANKDSVLPDLQKPSFLSEP